MTPLLLVAAAVLDVAGPVTFSVHTYAADVEIVAAKTARVAVSVAERPDVHPAIRALGGRRFEAEFDGKRQLHEGTVRVELPAGSSVDVATVLGHVTVTGVSGAARVRGMSGAVRVTGAGDTDIETVDGAIEIEGSTGNVRIHTTSGTTKVSAASFGEVELETASGAAAFRGVCAARCHIDVDSVSAEVRFALAPESAFAASVITTSGHVRDSLGLAMKAREGWTEGRYRAGDGAIECETFSGDIVFGSR